MTETGGEKYLRFGKRVAWAANHEQRRFARQLVTEGSGPKKIAAALNKRFGLSVNGNSLGGFIFEHKGELDGPTWFLQFLSDGESPPITRPAKKKAASSKAERPARHTEMRGPSTPVESFVSEEIFVPPLDTGFNYEEYLAMSLREDRHAPGNGPLRLKSSAIPKRKSKEK